MNSQEILKIILRERVDQAEVYLSSNASTKIDVLNQKVESLDEIHSVGCGIRVIKDKKLGFAFTSDLEESAVGNAIASAIHNAKCPDADEFNSFPSFPSPLPSPLPFSLFDPVIENTPIEEKIKLAMQTEKCAYAFSSKIKKTEKVSYEDSNYEIWIANSNGVNGHFKGNFCGLVADCIAEEKGEMETGFGLQYTKKYQKLNTAAVGEEAARRATELLEGEPIPSQNIDLVFDPLVGTQILEVLAGLFSAEACQKGKSLFAGKIGESVGSNLLNITDHGRLEDGIASTPFDAEGVPTQETILVSRGKLTNYLYNYYSARKENRSSTGNAGRNSFNQLPVIGPTNFFIHAGTTSPQSIINSCNKALYVTRLMGLHTANPISGDFSFGAAGILIENGKKGRPVRGITIAGNLIQLLESITAVGPDLRFIANFGSPTLLISQVTVSGE